ncbi:amidase family protein [Streptomyces sp. NPDC059355]|uniref:amidase family protein n=1 Tax=Streptomyces sp. NPDC059355 TaxID=3346811 RepID=UPI0036A9FE52
MPAPIDPFTPAVELAAAIRRKEVSPVEVGDCHLRRMDGLDLLLNAFCHRADDEVRKASADAADAVVRAASPDDLPPLHGAPLPVKDLLDVAGWPTTCGSAGADRAPAAASDPVVRRFVDAGFVLLGKTTTSEFGALPFAESEALGISRSPWDPQRTVWNAAAGIPLADPDRVEPYNRALRAAARSSDSWSYVEAVTRAQHFSRRIVEGFVASFDLLVTPTMACLPPPVCA